MTLPKTCKHGVLIYERCPDCESSGDGPSRDEVTCGARTEVGNSFPECDLPHTHFGPHRARLEGGRVMRWEPKEPVDVGDDANDRYPRPAGDVPTGSCPLYGEHHFNGYGVCDCDARNALADPPADTHPTGRTLREFLSDTDRWGEGETAQHAKLRYVIGKLNEAVELLDQRVGQEEPRSTWLEWAEDVDRFIASVGSASGGENDA